MAAGYGGAKQYVKLEARLVLLAWLNGLFGYASNQEMLKDTVDVGEGFDATGRSLLYHHLVARGDKVKVPEADLARYDDHIRDHLQAMNAYRAEPITLRYFQHLAALYTEIYLDWYSNRRAQMLASLNASIADRGARKVAEEPQDAPFSEADLKKLAFWMATGSGKTLLLHLNYRQFLHYNTAPLDNILLITPSEGLTEQHLAELAASNIPARRFDLNESSLSLSEQDTVRVIEITKLVQEKRGGGVSVPVEAFEGNNLIFVDEGHKGSGGVAWRGFREDLGETGFTFEYSATFGQALTAARKDELTAEYGKAIAFDYSYRYFYGDGYGKDFSILNLREDTREDQTETLLLGNLLSFYEQLRVFEDQGKSLRPYNLERPLWVFVGSTVNAVYTEDKRKRSDVLTVTRFLHHVLENKGGWVAKTIRALLEGKSGLRTPDGTDVFVGRFAQLRKAGLSPAETYQQILEKVLRTPTSGGLHLCAIRGQEGEIGLRASGADDYFGLVYIGDTSAFKSLVEADEAGITLEEDAISESLFATIGQPDTTLDILIGAKKFMEGWNSWRVSNMGLLNIGRQEGSQIIQLFGRGVRLRGRDLSLKRSAALSGQHPDGVRLLETLNIFAVRANYMGAFRDYLEREGVETQPILELPLFIHANEQLLRERLVVPRVPENQDFAREAALVLSPDQRLRVRVDMSLKVQTMQSSAHGIWAVGAQSGQMTAIPADSLALVDWERAYLDLLEYKERRGLRGLVIPRDAPKRILATEPALYQLVADNQVVRPTSWREVALLQEAVTSILCKYADEFYRERREMWESARMVYRTLDASDPNISLGHGAAGEGKPAYVISIPQSETRLIVAVKDLIAHSDALYNRESRELPRIHFDRHLYQPLLRECGNGVTITPPGLNESESKFVSDIKSFCTEEGQGLLREAEVFLLRNLSRGGGISFFEERRFYPDFILWIIKEAVQHIVFVEPHGMIHAEAYQHDPKARLHERLPDLARQISARSNLDKPVSLDSYIISATPYDDLRTRYDDGSWDRRRFAQAHILFPERRGDYDYLRLLVSEQLSPRA